jgi:outer membrane protein assembly factor BamB
MSQIIQRTLALAGCLALLAPANLRAQDWPQWRGPNRDGKIAGFTAPDTWPTQLKQQWKIPLGTGDSTPALVGGKLYLFGREDTDEVVLCVDAATGKTVWQEKYPADYVVTGPPARHPGPRSSPVVADGKICVLGVGGILSCLDASTGKLLWRKSSAKDYLDTPYRGDSSMSPLVVNGLCIVQVGVKQQGAMIAFDLASGEAKWKWAGDAPGNSSPVLMTVDGVRQIVTFTAKSLVGVGLADGKLLWEVPFLASQGGNNTTPVIDGQTVIYTGAGKGLFALKVLHDANGFTTTNLWSNTKLGAQFTTPVLKDGLLYGFTGRFFCASAKTGETLWTDSTGRGQTAALIDAGTVILSLTGNGQLVAYKPGDKEYAELASLKVADAETWAHPVVAGRRIFIRDLHSAACWTLD